MSYTRNLIFYSVHKDWCICESEKPDRHGPEVVLDFYNGDPDVLTRCSFLVQPLQHYNEKLQNCKNVIGPVEHPAINGQPLPHPPHLVPQTPPPPLVLPACIPTCPAGTTGGTALGPTSAASHQTSPGVSSLAESGRKSSFHLSFSAKNSSSLFTLYFRLKTFCQPLYIMHENYPFQSCYENANCEDVRTNVCETRR